MQRPKPKYTPMEIEELAADAQACLNSKGLQYAFAELQEEYLTQLIQAEVGGLTASTAHASMKVLEAVKDRLQAMVNEKLVRANRR